MSTTRGGFHRGRGFWRGRSNGSSHYNSRGQWPRGRGGSQSGMQSGSRGRTRGYPQYTSGRDKPGREERDCCTSGEGNGGSCSRAGVNQSQEVSEQVDSLPKRRRTRQATLTNCPYKHWKLYLPEEDYISDMSGVGLKVSSFLKHFKCELLNYAHEDIDMDMSVSVDYNKLKTDRDISSGIPHLSEELKNTPELILNCIALAFHTVLEVSYFAPCEGDKEEDRILKNESLGIVEKRKFAVRLYGYESESEVSFKKIKAPLYGKCVSVSGTVLRVSSIKPLVTQLAFACVACQETNTVLTPDGKYLQPTSCCGEGCRSRTFTPMRSSHLTETIDWQKIRLQELTGDDKREVGRIPRMIECELTSDLVDSCVPGDVVTVTAVVKATGSNDESHSRSKDKCMFMLYLQAISIIATKPTSHGNSGTEFTLKDYYAIEAIHGESDILRLLVGSLCPTIYGHELVKAGLLLCLFGGKSAANDDQKSVSVRGNPHILVVGDPGLGKSQMLQAAANVAPRGVYVCGNTSTATGLTVTLTKEPGSSQYSLEAGALVMADQGCCCIDEFDKMSVQHQALLEAMEQQSISIAKAGIVCTLPARASILAAANPVGGHYNKGKTVSENLKMNGALLSRFDLVFILLDKPDEEMDCLLSEHVMSLHSKRSKSTHTASATRNNDGSVSMGNRSLLDLGGGRSLLERLKIRSKDGFDPLPTHLLRKYIAYARMYVHPTLSDAAAKVLQEFYLQLRKNHHKSDSTPITTRQLESLIRLTEARAKLELREVATEQDAKDIIELMKNSMCDTYSNESGFLDFHRSQHGSGMSQKSQAKRFVSELTRLSENTGNSIFSVSQLREISQKMGLKVKSFEDFVYSLNNQGFLLKKGPNLYKVQTSSLM